MVSQEFINECKNRTNSNRLGIIDVSGSDISITNTDNLQKIQVDDSCYVDGKIIGTTYSKKTIIDIIDTNLTKKTIDKIIYPKIGVKFGDNTSEYINMGKYTIERPNNDQTANLAQITAYDDFRKLDEKYICNLDFSNNDIVVSDFYIDVCSQLGLIPKSTTFLNSDIPVSGNPFTNNETLRDVLSDIEEVACSWSELDWDSNEIDLVWLSANEEPDYVFEPSDYAILEGGQVTYGPINSLVIKDSQIEGENVVIEDDESIVQNGETQIAIVDNYFLYTEELRTLAIENIWNRVNGITYVDYKLTTYYGKPFLKCGSKIGVNQNDGGYFESYVLSHTFTYDGSFQSVISGPALTKEETKVKSNITIQQKVRRTEQITDKINGQIIEVVETQNEQQTQISKVAQDINNIQNLFQITGGNNLIKNSVGYFDDDYWIIDDTGIFEFGEDRDLFGKTTSSSKITIQNGTLKTSADNITGLTLDTIKSFNFKIKQDEDVTTTVTLYGLSENNPLYQETFTGTYDWQDIYNEDKCRFFIDSTDLTIKIVSTSTYDGIVQISDLMLNNGETQSWQPAQGEIWGTVIKMSQLGISCYSIDGGYVTMMTSQGFEVRHLYGSSIGDVISRFTLLGMETIDIKQSGKHTQIDLVHDMIESSGHDVYIEYIIS